MPFADVIAQFRAVIEDRPPVATGVLPVPKESCHLWFGQDSEACSLDMSDAAPEALAKLSAACQPAPFGRNDESVLDDTYRKARKMDKTHFACKLDEEVPKILDIVRPVLFTKGEEKTNIRTELYKLNVYDEGAFFKKHKDTPRSNTMIGSLVIAYPTPHAGGTLLFSKADKSWSLDSGSLLAHQPTTSIAYAVFFSDTDHEVLPVTSGRRVTVTYNLYLAPGIGEENPDALLAPVHGAMELKNDEDRLQEMVQRLLDDPNFLPSGGLMGFGLQYQYPVGDRKGGKIVDVFRRLKGIDAAVFQACSQLGLAVEGKAFGSSERRERQWLLPKIPRVQGAYCEDNPEDLNTDLEIGLLVASGDAKDETLGNQFMWVTELTETARTARQTYATYGNDPSYGRFYTDLCFVAHVGLPGSRQKAVILPSFKRTRDYGSYKMDYSGQTIDRSYRRAYHPESEGWYESESD